MRIAFLTPEYPSELPDAGGLATYVHRMAHLLVSFGHEAEVFVSSEGNSETVMDRGVLLHRVNVRQNQLLTYRIVRSLTYRIANAAQLSSVSLLLLPWLFQAKALAAAMERRHSQAPFQLVQSADYQATGLFVRRCPERRHVVRCSVASDLYASIDRYYSRFKNMRGYLERRVMRAADFTYAPSRYLAEHFRNNYKIDVGVIRPPRTF
jgi:hypothetical protein